MSSVVQSQEYYMAAARMRVANEMSSGAQYTSIQKQNRVNEIASQLYNEDQVNSGGGYLPPSSYGVVPSSKTSTSTLGGGMGSLFKSGTSGLPSFGDLTDGLGGLSTGVTNTLGSSASGLMNSLGSIGRGSVNSLSYGIQSSLMSSLRGGPSSNQNLLSNVLERTKQQAIYSATGIATGALSKIAGNVFNTTVNSAIGGLSDLAKQATDPILSMFEDTTPKATAFLTTSFNDRMTGMDIGRSVGYGTTNLQNSLLDTSALSSLSRRLGTTLPLNDNMFESMKSQAFSAVTRDLTSSMSRTVSSGMDYLTRDDGFLSGLNTSVGEFFGSPEGLLGGSTYGQSNQYLYGPPYSMSDFASAYSSKYPSSQELNNQLLQFSGRYNDSYPSMTDMYGKPIKGYPSNNNSDILSILQRESSFLGFDSYTPPQSTNWAYQKNSYNFLLDQSINSGYTDIFDTLIKNDTKGYFDSTSKTLIKDRLVETSRTGNAQLSEKMVCAVSGGNVSDPCTLTRNLLFSPELTLDDISSVDAILKETGTKYEDLYTDKLPVTPGTNQYRKFVETQFLWPEAKRQVREEEKKLGVSYTSSQRMEREDFFIEALRDTASTDNKSPDLIVYDKTTLEAINRAVYNSVVKDAGLKNIIGGVPVM